MRGGEYQAATLNIWFTWKEGACVVEKMGYRGVGKSRGEERELLKVAGS